MLKILLLTEKDANTDIEFKERGISDYDVKDEDVVEAHIVMAENKPHPYKYLFLKHPDMSVNFVTYEPMAHIKDAYDLRF